ncbi:hypothetical protein FRC04_001247 [Tulasnella sp. 424]|nr:hypothetical protein FRC04_001247 [Tulasnella sp. 424]KAG8969619.1 hypothetical protein FRC05_001050 [Tulasnella sp. 425]
MSTTNDQYDLLIVTDATASMGVFLTALNQSIPEVIGLSTMSGAFKRLGIIAYRDYTDDPIIEWSGWNPTNLNEFSKSLLPDGGADYPEAAKTGLIKALDEVDASRNTLILWYTDAPPHHPSQLPISRNQRAEKLAFPNRSLDWMNLAYEAKAKNCTIFSFVNDIRDDRCYYVLLSQVTGGLCMEGNWYDSNEISRLTLNVLLTWMGNPPDQETRATGRPAMTWFFKTPPPQELGNMTEVESSDYLPRIPKSNRDRVGHYLQQMMSTLTEFTTKKIPQSKVQTDLTTLAKRFADPAEGEYRTAVYSALASIIDHNVVALTYNPVFGQLWRAVCKYRAPSTVPGEKSAPPMEREELVTRFSLQVGKIKDAQQSQDMKDWLENSYDSGEIIREIISDAPNLDTAQWMYIDLDSFGDGGVNLTRIELVEASRSCASSVMAQLVKIFTHCKLVEPGVKLAPQQRSLPLSLRPLILFELMPHLVVPGVMFSARPALIMALLATIVGVPFLLEPARVVLENAKGSWIDIDVPENISYEFARLVLKGSPNDLAVRLNDEERAVYDGMRKYKLLELNLDGPLTATTGWTPSKSREVGDDQVECKSCKIKRSKTVMRNDPDSIGVCAACWVTEMDPKSLAEQSDDEACWVECSAKTCRAQYVIMNPKALNVRPKCWYCRNAEPCPFVECTSCRNRIIMPEPYQKDLDLTTYRCVACTTKRRRTIVDVECNLRQLVDENGVEWLGVKKTPDVFSKKSAFKLVQANTPAFFALSEPSTNAPLVLHSKPILDVPDLIHTLFDRVNSGTVELATCTLCFESAPHDKLRPACGRSGCAHRLDEDCLKSWYGANKAGHLLTAMQLLCPFCRRVPTGKTMAKYNPQAAALGGLKDAMEDRGFYFAWCGECGFAKRALERACCDGDRLPNIRNFVCEECQAARGPRDVVAANPGETGAAPQPSTGPRITPCPKCGVMVEKTFGCNHITCVCGTHFCHVCGIDGGEDIYDHMNEAHGGIYDVDGDDDDDDGYNSE